MNAGPQRRFPRTSARTTSQADVTIERDKIRHRRPNDLLFDEGEAPEERSTSFQEHGGDVFEETSADWSDENEDYGDEPAWEDEPEDSWDEEVFDREGAPGHVEDEGGIIWERDASPPDDTGDITFDAQQDQDDWAPEVELAGRRDIRPKPPRPAPQPHPGASRRPTRQGPVERRHAPEQPRGHPRRRQVGLAEPEEDAGAIAGPSAFAPAAAVAGTAEPPPPGGGRFARTRATIDSGQAGPPGSGRALDQQRRSPSSRRRKATQTNFTPPLIAREHSTRRNRKLAAIAGVLVIAVGGWFAYPLLNTGGIDPMIDRLIQLLPLPGSGRTASDTSFNEPLPPDSAEAERALTELERQVQSQEQEGGVAAKPEAIDPATIGTLGPPIPELKPVTGATRSLSAEPTAVENDSTELATSEGGDGDDASVFERLWRYLSPG